MPVSLKSRASMEHHDAMCNKLGDGMVSACLAVTTRTRTVLTHVPVNVANVIDHARQVPTRPCRAWVARKVSASNAASDIRVMGQKSSLSDPDH